MSRTLGYFVYDQRVGAPLALAVVHGAPRRRRVLANIWGAVTLFRSRAAAKRAAQSAHKYWYAEGGHSAPGDYVIYRASGASQGKQEPQ